MTGVLGEAPGEDGRSRQLLALLMKVWSCVTVAITVLSEHRDLVNIHL